MGSLLEAAQARPFFMENIACVAQLYARDTLPMHQAALGANPRSDNAALPAPIHLKQEELGSNGPYHEFQRAVEKHFHARRKREGKSYVGVNVIGAGNAALSDLGFAPQCSLVHR